MSAIKHRDFILEAIDQLRRRKARPDRERICSYILRRFGVDHRSTIADLERLVDEQTVIKVEYKGNISYRNAAKWSKLSVHKSKIEVELSDLNKLESIQSETERMSYVLRCAVSELICREPDYLESGVPVFELEQHLTSKDSEFFARISFNVLLNREATAGTVVKLQNGNYSLGPASTMCSSPSGSEDGARGDRTLSPYSVKEEFLSDETLKKSPPAQNGVREPEPAPEPKPDPEPQPDPQPEPDPAMNHKETDEPTENTGYRVGERRKRAKKKVFDPSDNNLPKAKRRGRQSAPAAPTAKASPAAAAVTVKEETAAKEKADSAPTNKLGSIGTGPVAVCALCISAIVDGKAISCRDCTQKAHLSCLIKGNRARFRPNTWQCMSCKTCQMCLLTEEVGTVVVCINCDDGYHLKCHIPKPKIPWKKWLCYRCAPPEPKPPTPEKPTTPVSAISPTASITHALPKLILPKIEPMDVDEESFDESVPDASEWTTDEVFDFFRKIFPEHAKVFRDQEIDGRSLLLMTRSDVINGLHLKLGPALRIYGQVKKLQLRRSETHLFWE